MRTTLLLALAACAPATGHIPLEPAEKVEVRPTEGTPWLILTDARVRSAEAPHWDWEADIPAILHVTLVNTRADDHLGYPLVHAEAHDERVEVQWEAGILYGIFGRTSFPLQIPVTAHGVPAGTEVSFTLRTSSLGCLEAWDEDCFEPDEVTLTATVR